MIRPEALSPEQKRLLLKRYRLDIEEPFRFRRRFRFAIMFSWIRPLLAAGLLWDGTPGSTAFADKPAEFLAWCFIAVLLFGDAFLFLDTWRNVRPGGQDERYMWYVLFRDRIASRAPSFLRWIARSSSIAIVLIAVLTGRPILAAAWTCTIASSIARNRWEDRMVRLALAKLEPQQPAPVSMDDGGR